MTRFNNDLKVTRTLTFVMGLAIASVLVISLAAQNTKSSVGANKPTRMRYKVVGTTNVGRPEAIEEILNDQAKDGWQYQNGIFIDTQSLGGLHLVFARPE